MSYIRRNAKIMICFCVFYLLGLLMTQGERTVQVQYETIPEVSREQLCKVEILQKEYYYQKYLALWSRYNIDRDYATNIFMTVAKYCRQYDIKPDHIMALIGVESNFRQHATSYLGSEYGRGLCQVSLIVLKEYNRYHDFISDSGLYGIENNIKVACWYYSRLRTHYKIANNIESLMSAYNRGLCGGYATTYVSKIYKNLNLMQNRGTNYGKI